MSNSSPWSVDQLAAGQLLSDLHIEITDDLLHKTARHFSRHRQSLMAWAAEQAHRQVVRKLEATPRDGFDRQSDEWASGFSFAEECVMTMRSDELLELAPERERTKGQILRALVRRARAR